jgi:hypothetical protein
MLEGLVQIWIGAVRVDVADDGAGTEVEDAARDATACKMDAVSCGSGGVSVAPRGGVGVGVAS